MNLHIILEIEDLKDDAKLASIVRNAMADQAATLLDHASQCRRNADSMNEDASTIRTALKDFE